MNEAPRIDLSGYLDLLDEVVPIGVRGRVMEVTGLVIRARVPGVRIGELCLIDTRCATCPCARRWSASRRAGVPDGPRGPQGLGPDSEVVPAGT